MVIIINPRNVNIIPKIKDINRNKMRLGKKILKRPKCENCGERLYQIRGPFKEYFFGDIPQHCPKCGVKISFDNKIQLVEHDDLIWSLLCITIITFMIVILVIVGLVSKIS